MADYAVKNGSPRSVAFKKSGGFEVIGRGESRKVEGVIKLSDDAIAALAAKDVAVSDSDAAPEPVTEVVPMAGAEASVDSPAEKPTPKKRRKKSSAE